MTVTPSTIPSATPPLQTPVPGEERRLSKGAYLSDLGNWLAGSAVIVALLFSIPVVTIIAFVLVPASPIWAHLVATVLPNYLINTLLMVLLVGGGVLLLGVPTAWLLTLYRFPGQRLFEWLLILPLAMPAYVIAYAYTDFLQFTGPPQTLLRELTGWSAREYWFPNIFTAGGAATMLTLVLYPYVYLLARSAFLEQSVCALEVSRTLGCTPFQSFYRVALPLARPAIIGGMILALMETLADFGTVSYFGIQTFTTGIYRAWFSMGDPVAAAQLSSDSIAGPSSTITPPTAIRSCPAIPSPACARWAPFCSAPCRCCSASCCPLESCFRWRSKTATPSSDGAISP